MRHLDSQLLFDCVPTAGRNSAGNRPVMTVPALRWSPRGFRPYEKDDKRADVSDKSFQVV